MQEKYLSKIKNIYLEKGWKIFDYQYEAWKEYLNGNSLIINSPTGTGKTYAAWVGPFLEALENKQEGIKIVWITPLRALAKDITEKLKSLSKEVKPTFKVELRTGDVSYSVKQKQLKNLPDCIVTTPESLHVLFSNKGYERYFEHLQCVVIDEWHELFGNKRGVQAELAVSRLKHICPNLKLVGISATIGNFDQAVQVLFKNFPNYKLIKSEMDKVIDINTVYPKRIENFSWSGHIGLTLLNEVIEIVNQNKSTLIFTNTRSQTELWYQKIIDKNPELEGFVSVHHGSLSDEERNSVEENLHKGKLKCVICTSSLDLGVDFRNVDCIIQIGSPKNISRFVQRAGRSGHSPYETSKIYFVPTYSLELLDAAALKEAVILKRYEAVKIIHKPLDVLIQYIVTLAVSDGFESTKLFDEVKTTYTYQNLTKYEWNWCLDFVTNQTGALKEYMQYSKVKTNGDFYYADDKKIIRMHKLSIGTITSDIAMKIKFMRGGTIGSIEESFIAKLQKGDAFWYSGKLLEFISTDGMTAYVRKAKKKVHAKTPSWTGGRMPLSSELAQIIKMQIDNFKENKEIPDEIVKLTPVLLLQQHRTYLPSSNELMIEKIKTKFGFHYFIYTFEGRTINEGIASLIAFRIAKNTKVTFSIAMNDYGFELLSDKNIELNQEDFLELLSPLNVQNDLLESLNSIELGKRKFRDISRIVGLINTGYPGENRTMRSLQISSELLFDVFSEYDKDNLLIKQAYDEVLQDQLEGERIKSILREIQNKSLILKDTKKVTPFLFPILVDGLRDQVSSEQLEDIAERLIKD